ncbi:hypothetical protein BI291_14985 [Thalassotalea sp. PP2-459]|nr:hypothetical protein BI291_14985 [Thalassotalea sp. PP2-459]
MFFSPFDAQAFIPHKQLMTIPINKGVLHYPRINKWPIKQLGITQILAEKKALPQVALFILTYF